MKMFIDCGKVFSLSGYVLALVVAGFTDSASAFVTDGDLSDLINAGVFHAVDPGDDGGQSGNFVSSGFEITDGYYGLTRDGADSTFHIGMQLAGPVGKGEGTVFVPYTDTAGIDPFFEQYSLNLDLDNDGTSEIDLLLKSFTFNSPATPANLAISKNTTGSTVTPEVAWISGQNAIEFGVKIDGYNQQGVFWRATLGAGSGIPPEDSLTAVVPLPAAVWFFASGLAGLASIARSKKL